MSTFTDLLCDARCRPDLLVLDATEIEDVCSRYPIRPELRDAWFEYGYGFFNRWADGTRASEFLNRLLAPSQVDDVRTEYRIGEADPFTFGVPFFETSDLNYLVLTSEGAIVDPDGGSTSVVAHDLHAFFRCLLDDPEFWLTLSVATVSR